MTDPGTDPERAAGSVPNAWGNALAWRWSRAMPTPLRRGFLTLLYALRTMANANGELRFHGDRKPIRIQDIAKAAGASEKDARRYINAALAAGVVGVRGERTRGRASLYVLILSPNPLWGAAEDSLKSSRRPSGKTPPPWNPGPGSSGHRDPNQFGGPRPELSQGDGEEVRAPATLASSGPRDPIGSGPRDPNNPGTTHDSSHERAGLSEQPQESPGARRTDLDPSQGQDDQAPTAPPPDPSRCPRCRGPMITRPGRPVCGGCERAERKTA